MTLKTHIGFLVMLVMIMNLIFVLNKKTRKKFEWWVPTGTATLMMLVIEVFGWTMYWFFVV